MAHACAVKHSDLINTLSESYKMPCNNSKEDHFEASGNKWQSIKHYWLRILLKFFSYVFISRFANMKNYLKFCQCSLAVCTLLNESSQKSNSWDDKISQNFYFFVIPLLFIYLFNFWLVCMENVFLLTSKLIFGCTHIIVWSSQI